MLTASRALASSASSEPKLPLVPALSEFYENGNYPRRGQVIMIAGRAGSQKTGFMEWYLVQTGLRTLYLSGDSTAFELTSRLACMLTDQTVEEVEQGMKDPERKEYYMQALREIPISFSFDSPITWWSIADELNAYVEMYDAWPEALVIDNLMNLDGAVTEYGSQMDSLQELLSLCRSRGITLFVLHHATSKGAVSLGMPPARGDIKNGLDESPQMILGVALLSEGVTEFRICPLKDRNGKSDPSGRSMYTRMDIYPERTQFFRHRHLREEEQHDISD